MLTIEITDGDWKMWDVRITILYEDDGKMMNDAYSVHAGERVHGNFYVR